MREFRPMALLVILFCAPILLGGECKTPSEISVSLSALVGNFSNLNVVSFNNFSGKRFIAVSSTIHVLDEL